MGVDGLNNNSNINILASNNDAQISDDSLYPSNNNQLYASHYNPDHLRQNFITPYPKIVAGHSNPTYKLNIINGNHINGLFFNRNTNSYFALTSNPDDSNGQIFVEEIKIRLSTNSDGKDTTTIIHSGQKIALKNTDGKILKQHEINPRGIVILPNGNFVLSSSSSHINETKLIEPALIEFSQDGIMTNEYNVPNYYAQSFDGKNQTQGIQQGHGFSSITLTPSGKHIYTACELPLAQDSNPPDFKNGAIIRVLKYNVANSNAENEYVYNLDPIPNPWGNPEISGQNKLVEMLAINDHEILIIERGIVGEPHYKNSVRIFRTNFENASNIIGKTSLKNLDFKACEKVIISDLENSLPRLNSFKNIENSNAMTIGKLPDGSTGVIYLSTNLNANLENQTSIILRENEQKAEQFAKSANSEVENEILREENWYKTHILGSSFGIDNLSLDSLKTFRVKYFDKISLETRKAVLNKLVSLIKSYDKSSLIFEDNYLMATESAKILTKESISKLVSKNDFDKLGNKLIKDHFESCIFENQSKANAYELLEILANNIETPIKYFRNLTFLLYHHSAEKNGDTLFAKTFDTIMLSSRYETSIPRGIYSSNHRKSSFFSSPSKTKDFFRNFEKFNSDLTALYINTNPLSKSANDNLSFLKESDFCATPDFVEFPFDNRDDNLKLKKFLDGLVVYSSQTKIKNPNAEFKEHLQWWNTWAKCFIERLKDNFETNTIRKDNQSFTDGHSINQFLQKMERIKLNVSILLEKLGESGSKDDLDLLLKALPHFPAETARTAIKLGLEGKLYEHIEETLSKYESIKIDKTIDTARGNIFIKTSSDSKTALVIEGTNDRDVLYLIPTINSLKLYFDDGDTNIISRDHLEYLRSKGKNTIEVQLKSGRDVFKYYDVGTYMQAGCSFGLECPAVQINYRNATRNNWSWFKNFKINVYRDDKNDKIKLRDGWWKSATKEEYDKHNKGVTIVNKILCIGKSKIEHTTAWESSNAMYIFKNPDSIMGEEIEIESQILIRDMTFNDYCVLDNVNPGHAPNKITCSSIF